MKVILLKDIPRVGKRHDIKEMNDGYALNFLFPRNLAEKATPHSLAELEKRKKQIEIGREIEDNLLMRNLNEIKDKVLTIKGKANEKGSLFSSIHKKEIVEELKNQLKADISPDFIMLEKPIKEIGEFEIIIQIKNQKTTFKLKIEKI